MNIDVKDILALLGEKTVQMAILEGQVKFLAERVQMLEKAPEKVPESEPDQSGR